MILSFYPCTQQVHKVQRQLNAKPPSKSPLSASLIIQIAIKDNTTSNPFEQLYQLRSALKEKECSDAYFNVNTEDVQSMINQLNVQCTLSKKQLNQLKPSGYHKLKVMFALDLTEFQSMI